MKHLVDYRIKHGMKTDNTLHVVGVISNPADWQSRLRLFQAWKKRTLATPNVKLYVVEGVFGDLHGQCAPQEGEDYQYLEVNLGRNEAWLKENLINIAVERLVIPAAPNFSYLCWEDCDVEHEDKDWAAATIRALQTFNVVQTWSHGVALCPKKGALTRGNGAVDNSFGFLSATGQMMSWGRHMEDKGYAYAHSGYSWACTRLFWTNVKGLIDFCVIGSADHHMAWAIHGNLKDTVHGQMSQGYKNMVQAWSDRAKRVTGGVVGYVSGLLKHEFHGPTRGRGYVSRWAILTQTGYDPTRDIAYDGQGVLQLVGQNKAAIQRHLYAYNRARIEDSIETV